MRDAQDSISMTEILSGKLRQRAYAERMGPPVGEDLPNGEVPDEEVVVEVVKKAKVSGS